MKVRVYKRRFKYNRLQRQRDNIVKYLQKSINYLFGHYKGDPKEAALMLFDLAVIRDKVRCNKL